MNQQRENLKELFKKFVSTIDAQRAAEEVAAGEQMLAENPAPQPAQKLIAEIKSTVAQKARDSLQYSIGPSLSRITAVAASLIALAVTGVLLFRISYQKPAPAAQIIPEKIWESSDITADDAELMLLNDELNEIENELMVVQLGEKESDADKELNDLELEIIEVRGDFWKG